MQPFDDDSDLDANYDDTAADTPAPQITPRKSRKILERVNKRGNQLSKLIGHRANTKRASKVAKDASPHRQRGARPIPLTKDKLTERQKPLALELERVQDPTKASQHKPNTIDVLKHLVAEFEPPTQPSAFLDIVHESFRTHMLFHLNSLLDTQTSIANLSREILRVQKRKQETRTKIYELREQHAFVGNEMNRLRAQYRDTTAQWEDIEAVAQLTRQLASLPLASPSPLATVELNLALLHHIVNPVHGLAQKLAQINDKLASIKPKEAKKQQTVQ